MIDFTIIFLTVFYKYIFVITKHQYMNFYVFILLIILFFSIIKLSNKIIKNKMPNIGQWPASTLIIILITIYLTIVGKDANFLIPFILGIVFSYDNPDRLVKFFLISSAICFGVHNILNLIGIIPNQFELVRINNGVYTLRSAMGFEHPNNGFLFLLPIVFGIYYFSKTYKQKIFGIIISLSVSLYVYYRTVSRSGLIIICVYLIIVYFLEKKLYKHKFLFKIGRYSFFIIAIFSIFLAYKYGTNAEDPVTIMLTGRPSIWYTYLNQGIHLFGTPLNVSPSDFFAQYGSSLDNYYIFILIYFGFVGFMAIGILYYKLLKYLENRENIKLYFIVIAFLVYGFTETNTMIFSINFTHAFLFLPYFISKNYERSRKNLLQIK